MASDRLLLRDLWKRLPSRLRGLSAAVTSPALFLLIFSLKTANDFLNGQDRSSAHCTRQRRLKAREENVCFPSSEQTCSLVSVAAKF